jgi:hypothetical protein
MNERQQKKKKKHNRSIRCPEARFMLNFSGHNAIVNTLACNGKVLFSGGDNGRSVCSD